MWITRKKHLCILQEVRDAYEKLLDGRKQFTSELMETIDKRDEVISVLSDRIDNLMKENEELKKEKAKTIKQLILDKISQFVSNILMIG